MKHILFVCTLNQIRSKTAETVYKKDPRFEVRSAGTASNARIPITSSLVTWADVIFVMEKEHERIVRHKFPNQTEGKKMIALDIPDDNYSYMDPDLIAMLETQLAEYL